MWLPAVIVAPPAVEPISRDEAKEYLRVEIEDDSFDGQIDQFIAAARAELEMITGTRMLTQTVSIAGGRFADLGMLPIGPVQSITSIEYRDLANAEQLLDAARYELIGAGLMQCVAPVPGKWWPATAARADTVKVTAVVGYGDAGTDIPQDLRFVLLRAVRAMFDDRAFDMAPLLANHRIWM